MHNPPMVSTVGWSICHRSHSRTRRGHTHRSRISTAWERYCGNSSSASRHEVSPRLPAGLCEELISGAPTAFNEVIRSCWHLDPDQRPSAREVYNQLILCAAGLVDISPVLQPNMEDDIFLALALASPPFSPETTSFIVTRRASY